MTRPDILLWLSDSRGVYIPRDFALSFQNRERDVTGVDADEWAILEAGPDHEHYCDVWSDVEQRAIVTDENGMKYRLYQNGDLWLVPEGMQWDNELDSFVWPETVE